MAMTDTALTPYRSRVDAARRMRLTGSRPAVYWMTGLSGAGKSTVASLAEKMLIDAGHAAVMLDGDTVRTGLCRGLGFSPEDRHENLRRIAECAKLLALSGQIVIVCAISPTAESRRQAREIVSPAAAFSEVYVKADVEVCAARDPKGLYKKAFAGESENFTGVSAPYEEPEAPDLILDTAKNSAEACAGMLADRALFVNRGGERLLSVLLRAAREASDAILGYYSTGAGVREKEDRSPLTDADLASDKILSAALTEAFPEYAILSEEEADDGERLTNRAGVFIVDPLDGTKEFLSHNGEFCVSVGFAEGGRVRAGVVAVPAQSVFYYAMEKTGAYKLPFSDLGEDFRIGDGKRLAVSERTEDLIVAVSRSHPDETTKTFLEANREKIAGVVTAGSCLKGCLIAEGKADFHLRVGAFTKEWDTAGMQIVCEEAGAIFTDAYGDELVANRPDPVNRRGFRIANRRGTLEGLILPPPGPEPEKK